MSCKQAEDTQALFDGELDASAAAAARAHLAGCGDCQALTAALAATRQALADPALRAPAPAALQARVLASVYSAEPAVLRSPPGAGRGPRRFSWSGAFSGAAAAAVVAVAALVLVDARAPPPPVEELLGAHLRSLLPGHLIDVESSERHTVKPWFAGHTSVSPPVADYVAEDYRLVGGRADYVGTRPVAAIVYRHREHVLNVFGWPVGGAPAAVHATRAGYHVVCGPGGDLQLCVVSDAGFDALEQLLGLVQATAVADSRE